MLEDLLHFSGWTDSTKENKYTCEENFQKIFTMKQINSASLSETVLNFYINLTTMALYINLKGNLLLVTENNNSKQYTERNVI
jgi:hypothetical protein